MMRSAHPVPADIQPLGCGKVSKKPPPEGPAKLVKRTRTLSYRLLLLCFLPLILMVPVEPDTDVALLVDDPDDWDLAWQLAYKLALKVTGLVVGNSDGSLDTDDDIDLTLFFSSFIKYTIAALVLGISKAATDGIKKRLPYIKDAKAEERNKDFMLWYRIFTGSYTVQLLYETILVCFASFSIAFETGDISFTTGLPFSLIRTLSVWAYIPLAIGMAYFVHHIPLDAVVLIPPQRIK
ncbi:hypothetical protein KIPB_002763 [Kipferlia bialata]|uniref:Uncharacterized protein n=1 Tax=Kipferlia bialata TaxID=797122 RepID=A0A9K3CRW8_9EUKA|nr:hypothetical protein KIPB_002763 [Kipferlia bialata]|eukprot:g2763.t1